jgi:phosphoribosylformylglycinamidine synthase
VRDVRVGKQIVIEMNESDAAAAREKVAHMCEELLANTVIEDYEIEIQA